MAAVPPQPAFRFGVGVAPLKWTHPIVWWVPVWWEESRRGAAFLRLCKRIWPHGRREKPSRRQRRGIGPQHPSRPSAGNAGFPSSACARWVRVPSRHRRGMARPLGKRMSYLQAVTLCLRDSWCPPPLGEREPNKFFWQAWSLCLNKCLL